MADRNFAIANEKLEEIKSLFLEQVSDDDTEVENEIFGDWHNVDEHQAWLDISSPQEIVDWLASFYS